ncbi:ferric reduction oxidase 2, partial [Striga asiatica]
MDSHTPSPHPPPSGGGNNKFRAAIMAAVVAVFAGYLLLWVMMPTNAFRKTWLPELRAQTVSTYFGTTQGATYLVFTFPILFIAVLGCVYLHLGKNSTNIHAEGANGGHWLSLWKRPATIKGLGIVTRIELAFLLMWEARLDTVALRLGLVGNIALSFLFFPVTRGSSMLPLLGLTSEGSVKYHIWLGHIVMALFSAHGLAYIVYWAATQKLSEMLKWEKTGISNVAGELSLLAGLVLWATTFPRIRRKMFELFFYAHHLYILFVFFFVLHVGISYTCIMLPGFFLFMIDRHLRFLQSRQKVRLLSARLLPCQTVELNFSKAKGLRYTPTSIMFMNVPSISKLQWHPFTISSSSNLECDKLSVVIKGEGKWSNKLYQLLASPSSIDRLEVSLEVLISGGSGITPFISIIRELIHANSTLKHKTPKILLITAFKNSTDLSFLDLILPISGPTPNPSTLDLQIEAYVTREKTQEATKNTIRTLWFKPNNSDLPLAPVLGQNSYLWLGAIISSSFVIYLTCIGILTRYYIYPIDRNTNKIYSWSSRAVLHMLFICIGIVMTSTAAFLWNKGKNGREIKQIQSMEGGISPVGSPNSWFGYNTDRELESLPQQAFSQTVNVHYGEKPDIKKILFELKESSVGVLVCGPRSLRHEAAKICSSGLANNLHFESISFREEEKEFKSTTMASSGIITIARGAILVVALIVFLGNIMMWIIMPTDTYYNHWLIHILAHTNSTFFGIQGSTMLNFTFPILFIAVLGCLYLHLGKRMTGGVTVSACFDSNSKRDTKLRFLKRPMVVKGLGIVTIIELTLFTLFVALCAWYIAIIKWDDHYVSNIAGEISLLCGLALWVTTYPNIRRKMFELFFYTHYLYIGFIIFFILHIGIGFACIMLPGFYLFVIDRYLRFLQSRQNVRLISARVLPCQTIELNFAKSRGVIYNPTSTIFVNVPIISKLQWHPFTITSNSSLESENLSVLIKCEGSWTKNLYDKISSSSSIDHLQVSVEGPYGPASTSFLRYNMLVMISGGSGIAPFISIIRELIFMSSSTQNCKIPNMILISVFKNTSHLSMLDLIPPISHTMYSCNLGLRIEAHVTREKAQPTDKPHPIRTMQFKPSPSDAPIFQALGPNSWLWLATIILSSFVIFLVFLGIFTQYVVYPVDKNTYFSYSYAKKNLMNIFLICGSIVVAASGVFMWNKRQNAKEDMEKSGNTFGSMDGVELESFPLQSVVKSIDVHYGRRPDLKRILMGIQESNVGVLVSGPKEMRHDVAGVVGRACGYNNLCSLENWGPVCRCPWQVNREISELDERPEFSGNSCTHGGPGDDELVEISDVDWPKNDRTYKSEHRARVQRCLSPSCWKKRMPLSNGKLDTGLGSVAFLEVRKGW